MLRGVRKALLRFAAGEHVTRIPDYLIWNTGGALGWGTWSILKGDAYIQRRGTEWHISPRGMRAATDLHRFGTVGAGK